MLWRLAHDRVLVRHALTGATAELSGSAALAWVAVEEPMTVHEVRDELGWNDVDIAIDALAELMAAGWVDEAAR